MSLELMLRGPLSREGKYFEAGGAGSWPVGIGKVIEPRGIEWSASPSNNGMELTIKSVTPFAFAKAAPLLLAAHPRR